MFIFLASSSLMSFIPSLSHSAIRVARFSFLIFLGMRHPQPSSLSSPQRFTLLATPNTYDQRSSGDIFSACLCSSLFTRSRLHFRHTQRRILWMVFKCW